MSSTVIRMKSFEFVDLPEQFDGEEFDDMSWDSADETCSETEMNFNENSVLSLDYDENLLDNLDHGEGLDAENLISFFSDDVSDDKEFGLKSCNRYQLKGDYEDISYQDEDVTDEDVTDEEVISMEVEDSFDL